MSNKQTILIAGGDGLVGKHLVNIIDTSKYHVIILSRKKKISHQTGVEYAVWDTDKKTIDDIPSPDHIINLAGAGIADQRWTDQRKKNLLQVESTVRRPLKIILNCTKYIPRHMFLHLLLDTMVTVVLKYLQKIVCRAMNFCQNAALPGKKLRRMQVRCVAELLF